MQIFPHCDVDMWVRVWMSRFRRPWSSLNFYKEYLFGFETLVFASLGILSIHIQLVTLQRERKLEIVSYDPFKKMNHGFNVAKVTFFFFVPQFYCKYHG